MTGSPSPGSQTGQQETSDTTDARLEQFADPCAAYRKLSDQKLKLISGQGMAEFEYHGNGTQRRVKFSMGNMTMLENAIRQAQSECAKSIGMPNPGRRHAIQGGSRGGVLGVNEPGYRWNIRTGYWG